MIFKYSRDWPHCVQRCVGPLARDNKIFSAQFVPSLQFYRIIKRINDTPRTVFCLEILLLRQRFQKYPFRQIFVRRIVIFVDLAN